MILAAGLTPAWQQILVFDRFAVGEVNRAAEVHWCASGKVLNVGIALHHLGAESKTLSLIGGESGAAIQREFAGLGIGARWIDSRNPTRICTTILDRVNGTTTELVENAAAVDQAELDAFQTAFSREVASADVVILIGSLPSGTPTSFCADLLCHARARVVLDIRGAELLRALEHRPFLVKPNRAELAQTVGTQLDDERSLLAAMREVNQRGATWALVTDGPNSLYLTSASECFRFAPLPTAVVNPIGCGDCLAAGIACALQRSMSVVDAVRFGIAAAADNARQLLPSRLDPVRINEQYPSVTCEVLSSKQTYHFGPRQV